MNLYIVSYTDGAHISFDCLICAETEEQAAEIACAEHSEIYPPDVECIGKPTEEFAEPYEIFYRVWRG